MDTKWLIAVFVLVACSAMPVSSAHAQRHGGSSWDRDISLTCQSNDERYRLCRVDLGRNGTARIERRLSKAGCVRGQSWGYNRAGVWVNHGCRARFVISRRGQHHRGGHTRRGDRGYSTVRLTCQSDDKRYRLCRVDLGRGGTARIERQLSKASCIRGRSWGYNRAGVWVDRGCRARFAVDRRR